MTILSDIITEAYRESNLIAVGTQPTTAEQAEAVKLLERFINTLFGAEAGEKLLPINIGKNNTDYEAFFYDGIEDWFLPLNKRVMLNLEDPKSILLHPIPQDGSRLGVLDVSGNVATYNFTINGNGRNIEGQPSVVLDEDGVNRQWFYRADLGSWERLTDLDITSESPFPSEYDDLLIIGLAIRLASRNGKPMAPESTFTFNRLTKDFKANYAQTIQQPSELALIRTPGTWWYRGYYGSEQAFLRGDPLW